MPLLDAIRALASFQPPPRLPDCDFDLLGHVLEAHGLAPMASYQLENTRLGATAPESLRERLLTSYQGVVNDNVLRLVSLRNALKAVPDVPAILLEAAGYVDWLYPHMAFRPVLGVRLAVRAMDGARFAKGVEGLLSVARTEHHGHTAVFTDGRIELALQEGLWQGAAEDAPLYERRAPYPAFGPSAARPAAEDALLATVGDQALLGLYAPLVTFVDLRELLSLPDLDLDYVRRRAEALGLARALYGASRLVARFFPEVEARAAAARPTLGLAERVAVDRVVETADDPTRLAHLRGGEAAARLVVAPHAP